MKKISYICSGIALLWATSCGQSNNEANDASNKSTTEQTTSASIEKKDGYQVFEDKDFVIQYPQEWTKETQNSNPDIVVMLTSPNDGDDFSENINIIKNDLGQKLDLNELINSIDAELTSMMPDIKWEKKAIEKINGRDVGVLVYEGTQMNMKMKFEQRCYVNNTMLYILTMATAQETYSKYKDIGNDIMTTFQIK